ncbi:C-type lectin 37Db [Eurytemora carolleeae]|uniref:C-type lectin 37Db n=1 Tax=Eurytemora carolleeae TaxID=1294199 RepID=UPI000C76CA87|nr:C-type lectin 37Db [Eurytemora carolleeae]|eukprot:XP_023345272.1 C-type lectin 37Db-like [Eurytemora affinis]
MVDDLRLEFTTQHEQAKSDQQNITTMTVESLRKEVKSLIYLTVGYEKIPGAGQFLIPTDSRTWIDAKRYCESKLGFLVEFVNRELEETVKNYVKTNYEISTFWLGARDHQTEGVFKWESTNQTLDELYTNWGEGEPNNHDDREDCAEFSSFAWNDMDCSESRRFICQLKSSP